MQYDSFVFLDLSLKREEKSPITNIGNQEDFTDLYLKKRKKKKGGKAMNKYRDLNRISTWFVQFTYMMSVRR